MSTGSVGTGAQLSVVVVVGLLVVVVDLLVVVVGRFVVEGFCVDDHQLSGRSCGGNTVAGGSADSI